MPGHYAENLSQSSKRPQAGKTFAITEGPRVVPPPPLLCAKSFPNDPFLPPKSNPPPGDDPGCRTTTLAARRRAVTLPGQSLFASYATQGARRSAEPKRPPPAVGKDSSKRWRARV